ncbi:hypothetical protein ABIE65_005228 [Constrictibacter sp. MBR-5]|jgi:hypothetical protein|uniref:DUF6441 family protein n=1 Tax=Constrictibacter sp. MBR-5 TaxID=3156467 RepID=UPI003393ADD5
MLDVWQLFRGGTGPGFLPDAGGVMDQPTAMLRAFARAGKRAIAAGRTTTVIMFVLLPQTRLKKRLDVKGAGERWVGRLPGLILKEWQAAPVDAALSRRGR